MATQHQTVTQCPSRRGARATTVLVLALSCIARPGLAQVSVESFRERIPDDGVAASVDARLTGKSGNTNGLDTGAAGFLGGRSQPHLAFLALAGDYKRYDRETQVAEYFGHLRYNLGLASRLWLEAFGQVEHDEFRRLVLRRLLGTGPRVRLLDTEPLRAYFGTAYMLEVETLAAEDESPRSDSTSHRWSNYLSALLKVHDRITLSVMAFYQPRFDKLSDYRVLALTSAEFEVTPTLSSSLQFNYEYDSHPPSGVRRADVAVVNVLGLRF
jgi:hypothetical protein